MLFYTLRPDGSHDPFSLHGSCPVISGTKWISQQWIRESYYEPHNSFNLVAAWQMDKLEGFGGTLYIEDTTTRRQSLFMMEERQLTGAALGAREAFKVCSKARPGNWPGRSWGDSGSSTIAAYLHVPSCDTDDGLTVTLSDEGRIEYRLRVAGCTVTATGPTLGSAAVTGKLSRGDNFVVLITESREGKQGPRNIPRKKWDYRNWLLLNEVAMGGEQPWVSETVAGVEWDQLRMCVRKTTGPTVSSIWLFDRALDNAELAKDPTLAVMKQWGLETASTTKPHTVATVRVYGWSGPRIVLPGHRRRLS